VHGVIARRGDDDVRGVEPRGRWEQRHDRWRGLELAADEPQRSTPAAGDLDEQPAEQPLVLGVPAAECQDQRLARRDAEPAPRLGPVERARPQQDRRQRRGAHRQVRERGRRRLAPQHALVARLQRGPHGRMQVVVLAHAAGDEPGGRRAPQQRRQLGHDAAREDVDHQQRRRRARGEPLTRARRGRRDVGDAERGGPRGQRGRAQQRAVAETREDGEATQDVAVAAPQRVIEDAGAHEAPVSVSRPGGRSGAGSKAR